MTTKVMTLNEVPSQTEEFLRRCCDDGQSLVIELPDHRRVSVQMHDAEDDLIDRLIDKNTAFRRLLGKSQASPLLPFPPPGA